MDRARHARLYRGSSAFLPSGSKDARGKDTISGIDPFVMQSDGKGWIYVAAGLCRTGRLPTHYEPEESVDQESALRPAMQPGAHGVAARTTILITARTTIRGFRM